MLTDIGTHPTPVSSEIQETASSCDVLVTSDSLGSSSVSLPLDDSAEIIHLLSWISMFTESLLDI